MPHYTQTQLNEAEEKRAEKEYRKKERRLRKQAKKLGVSVEYLRDCPLWMHRGEKPTEEEYTLWARNQHKRACKEYEAAYPLTYFHGRCSHMVRKKACVSFFGHTGICETGVFIPERIKRLTWSDFQKQARRAQRKVKEIIHQGGQSG